MKCGLIRNYCKAFGHLDLYFSMTASAVSIAWCWAATLHDLSCSWFDIFLRGWRTSSKKARKQTVFLDRRCFRNAFAFAFALTDTLSVGSLSCNKNLNPSQSSILCARTYTLKGNLFEANIWIITYLFKMPHDIFVGLQNILYCRQQMSNPPCTTTTSRHLEWVIIIRRKCLVWPLEHGPV